MKNHSMHVVFILLVMHFTLEHLVTEYRHETTYLMWSKYNMAVV